MSRERFLAFRRSLPRTPPLHRQSVRVRGTILSVYSSPPAGDGGLPPLLCINGGMLYGHDILWPALSPLARDRQVILYDQRGRGRSDAPADPLAATIDDDAADVGALRRALGIRRWDVLGHSWGGGIAALAVALDPGGVRRLVTVDAVGPTSAWMAPLRANVLARTTGDEHSLIERATDAELGAPDPALHAAYARAVYRAWFADPELAAFFTPPTATSATGAAVLARLRRDGYDWSSRLRSLSAPTLVLHGEEDALPVSVAAEWTTLLAHARPAVIPHAGHMPFWEAPELFFAHVLSFLAAPHPLSGVVEPSV